ncbi:glycoside hydrolase family 5 protein [Pisolithus croceorrhizus]|nr:glycoside hydrolase family 5 protein [Pisolithus croceorrhizus]
MRDRRWFTVGGVAALLLSGLAVATVPTAKRGSSPFVQTDGTSFTVNGSKFKYVGTNSYWLPALNTEQDIWNTLGNISAVGAKVVRVWAFNGWLHTCGHDPSTGTWFQLVQNGTVSINDGPNGLQKLDTVVQMAQQHGLYVTMTLTNNWYPSASNSTGSSLQSRGGTTEITLPRNYLSNDYGGMDLYVHQFGLQYHDQFYTDQAILNAFQNFTSQVVSRYVNSPAIFSWELANDPRCNSTLPTSSSCTTETITEWHATMAQYIRSIDPNHLISSGNQGYMCTDCPKLYPLNTTPAPQPSPSQGSQKRNVPVTTEQLLRKRAETRRLNRLAAKLAGKLKEDGIRVRGRWAATGTRRQQAPEVGSAYDGSYGVDSQDIMNIPNINFGTFQLFPDQDSYAPNDSSLSSYQNSINSGVDWIKNQAQSAAAVGKPLVMTAFGLVTQDNAADFVPFNMTTAPYTSDSSYGVTNQQQTDAYSTWLNISISLNLAGMIQYQWGQQNLTAEAGTVISPGVTGITLSSRQVSSNNDTTGEAPNDGYTSHTNQNGVTQIIKQGSDGIAPDVKK